MAKKATKAKRAFTEDHRAKLSAAATRRYAKSHAEIPAAGNGAAKKKRKNARSPGGIRVLSRNGRGKDIIQADAEEVILAVRIMNELRKFV